MGDSEREEIEAYKNDFLRNIQSIAKKELPLFYGFMFDRQTVKAKKCKSPRISFYIIFNA